MRWSRNAAGRTFAAVAFLAFSESSAQSLVQIQYGHATGDRFGAAVGDVGDLDGDSTPDFLVGAPGEYAGGGKGLAYVFSGATGSALLSVGGGNGAAGFGEALDGAGDVNGDAFPDLLVADPYWEMIIPDAWGAAWVFSGLDGSLLHTVIGGKLGDSLGYAVTGAGDLNADGRADFAVSAPYADPIADDEGRVTVHSGADGSVLHEFEGDLANATSGRLSRTPATWTRTAPPIS